MLIHVELVAQPQATGLRHPVAIAIDPESANAFVVEQNGRRLLLWSGKGGDTEVLVEDLNAAPEPVDRIRSIVIREDKLSVIGTANGTPRLVTYKVGLGMSAELEEGLSGDLDLANAEMISCATSTEIAIYLASNSKNGGTLWRIEMGPSSFGKPTPIFSDHGRTITGLAVSQQGHVAAAWSGPEKDTCLRFHHAGIGQQLLEVATDVHDVSALSYSRAGLIYASCTRAERRGVFRFDVFFDGARQAVRATEVAQLDNLIGIVCSEKEDSVALVGGETDGRMLRLKLK